MIITPVLPTWSSSPALGSVRTRTWQNIPCFDTTGSAKPAAAKASSSWVDPLLAAVGTEAPCLPGGP